MVPKEEWESFDAVIVLPSGTIKHVRGSKGGLRMICKHVHAVKLLIQTSETEVEEVLPPW